MMRYKCLINLRPMWIKYFTTIDGMKNFDQIEDNVYNVMAEVIKKYSDIDFTFVPFNTDTFGMSDIDAGLRLQSLVSTSGNFQLKYEELDCNQMVKYIRSFDLAICMRLHACVFCWAVEIPTFGVEYADKPGKVSDFCDQHNEGNWTLSSKISILRLSEFLNENPSNS
ncbi:polysaccharide pyruvyl transferase family protein [Amylibacter sp.]|nr:polysaccharide pyruvyl transferase family protein [Amylibacter sp.]